MVGYFKFRFIETCESEINFPFSLRWRETVLLGVLYVNIMVTVKILPCHIAGWISVQMAVYRKLNVFMPIVIKCGTVSPLQYFLNVKKKFFIQSIPFPKLLQDPK